jgi:hypothetical protein
MVAGGLYLRVHHDGLLSHVPAERDYVVEAISRATACG